MADMVQGAQFAAATADAFGQCGTGPLWSAAVIGTITRIWISPPPLAHGQKKGIDSPAINGRGYAATSAVNEDSGSSTCLKISPCSSR
jgi:hypothetical protein